MPKQTRFAIFVLASMCSAASAAAQSTTGIWDLDPPQEPTLLRTAVQQPINADGTSNFKNKGKSVIPVSFSLMEVPGPVVFRSIGSDIFLGNDFSFLTFTPDSTLNFEDITNLSAVYNFSEGNCHGGSLRWSVRVSVTASVNIYYGNYPNFTDCTSAGASINQSGLNLMAFTDLRFDTSQLSGGMRNDNYAGALALAWGMPVLEATLLLNGGWAGDQVLTLGNVTVNDNTFVPNTAATNTCDLPLAEIQITKLSTAVTGPVNEATALLPADYGDFFRIVDCKYMYNLATRSLSGPGRYKVEVMIDGSPVTGAAEFDLR